MSDDALQAATSSYAALQQELQSAVDARQRLDAQKAENETVKSELATLKEHNTVYKLVGSVLVEQDQSEARLTVDKRLEFIANEITRVEGQIKDLASKSDGKKHEIATLQAARQPQSVAAA